jgi:RecA-family ATPase
LIDQYADQLGCSFVLVHHASKGNQSGKSVTDVGAGAGSQSRATDTHLVLRQHQEPGCVVVDAAVRSWPPLDPCCLRWEFPVWQPDDYLDPADLKFERLSGRGRSQLNSKSETAEWTAESFAKKFVTEKPEKMTLVRSEASKAGISQRLIKELQEAAEQQGLIYRWKSGANKPVSLANIPQPEEVMA